MAVREIGLPSHVKALISGNIATRMCMMVDICVEARGSRNAGGEQKSDRNNGDRLVHTAQIKSQNEGIMTS